MSLVIERNRKEIFNQLSIKNELAFRDIQQIVDSLQIASGNASGVGKIIGILQFIEKKSILIRKTDSKQVINTKRQFAELINGIDDSIDLESDSDFKKHF